jgi:CheY-like chemotaxis protein
LNVTVTDTGIGIDAADAERLFEPFTQLHDEAKIRHGGTGLGLALTRRLAQLLDGDVHVESSLGEGSTFTLHVAAPDAAASATEPNAAPLVLIIDDVRVARESVRKAIEALPVRMHAVGSASAALDAFHKMAPKLLVLDINLLDGSGWRVLEEIRAHPKGKRVQAIVVSVEADHALGRSLGVYAHLSKPFDPAHLAAAVSDALSLSGASAQQAAPDAPAAKVA